MKEYIEREALLVKLEQIAREPDYQHEGEDWLNGVIIAQEEVIDAPAADVVERKRGEWTLNKDGSGTCNQCHFTQKNVWDYDSAQNYCGVCGADMRSHHDSLCDQTEEGEA